MNINFKYISDILVVSPSGRIDCTSAISFEDGMQKLINSLNRMVILDLSNLDYVSSAGLRSILVSAQRARSLGGALTLYGLTGSIERVFHISGFDRVLGHHTSIESAVSELNKLNLLRFAA
jgi:anti-anti-sigma factor